MIGIKTLLSSCIILHHQSAGIQGGVLTSRKIEVPPNKELPTTSSLSQYMLVLGGDGGDGDNPASEYSDAKEVHVLSVGQNAVPECLKNQQFMPVALEGACSATLATGT